MVSTHLKNFPNRDENKHLKLPPGQALYTWAVFEPYTKTGIHQHKTGMFSFVNKDLITMPHSQTVMFLEYQNPAPSNKLRTSKLKFYHQKHFKTKFLTWEIQPSFGFLRSQLEKFNQSYAHYYNFPTTWMSSVHFGWISHHNHRIFSGVLHWSTKLLVKPLEWLPCCS